MWRKGTSCGGRSPCKGPGAESGLVVWRNREEAIWLGQNGGGRKRERGRAGREGDWWCRAWGPGEDLDFDPREVGALEGGGVWNT